jgi:uncharacterized membrane protein (DUF106 family)
MKKSILLAIAGVSLIGGVATAKMWDWNDLEKVRMHLHEAIDEMDRAREKNHYDMEDHGKRAVEAMKDAERELHEAIESAKHHH